MRDPKDSGLVISLLVRDYPDVYADILQRIEHRINTEVPSQILDSYSHIPTIVDGFLQAKGINSIGWKNEKNTPRITETREMLIAVLLMFYHPHRLLGLETKKKSKHGLVKAIAQALKCKLNPVSNSVMSALVAYKTYKSFQDEVSLLYEIIKENKQIFKNGN